MTASLQQMDEVLIPPSLLTKIGVEVADEKQGISEERINEALPKLREMFSRFREYPDELLDLVKDPNEKFNFYYYQRVFLRAAVRHRYFYGVFPRAYSKSFLSFLALYVRCILYPGAKLFIVSGGKEQAVKIATEKLEEIWKFFPALRAEVYEGTGPQASKIQRDHIQLKFKNGSSLDVVAARDSSRGGRRTGGLIEEVILVDGQMMSEVILPLMNVSRRAACGTVDPNDVTNKSQIYITTAGEKGTYSYDKLIQILIWSLVRPKESIILGGTWRIPVLHELLDKNFTRDLKEDGTYTEETFLREYESVWAGGTDGAYFDSDAYDRCRVLETPLTGAPTRMPKNSKFILSYDVGRTTDQSSCSVFYIEKNASGSYNKSLVNIYAFDKMHFKDQANSLKRIAMAFNAEKIIIDANGLGIGLVDFLTVKTEDEELSEILPAFGVDKTSDEKGNYRRFYREGGIYAGMLYLIKANESFNNEAHVLAKAQLANGKVRLLVSDKVAKYKLERTKEFREMTPDERIKRLKPHVMTSLLRDEMLNLKKKGDGQGVTLARTNLDIPKDKFSSFEYGLWYIRELEKKMTIRSVDLSELQLGPTTASKKRDRNSMLERLRSRKGGRKYSGTNR